MGEFNFEFSEWAFSKFIFAGLAIFFFFRFGRFLLFRSLSGLGRKQVYLRYLPFAEFFVWIVFLLWSVSNSTENNHLLAFSGILLLLYISFWLSRFVFRGFIAGVIFRFGGRFKTNETIKVGDYSGKIIRFRNQSIEIETDRGEIVFLPYAQVIEQVNIKTDNAETIRNYSFTFNAVKQMDIEQLKQEIKTSIFLLPWASVKKDPQIVPLAETENYFQLKITVYSIEREYFHKIEKFITDRFQYTEAENL